mmetsp:Transcript_34836/g.80534  ORF Transcript_34836/g.80534 Transcript_34836/m.80534 type:complete len:208 (-) Transcript_34836:136-759(-)
MFISTDVKPGGDVNDDTSEICEESRLNFIFCVPAASIASTKADLGPRSRDVWRSGSACRPRPSVKTFQERPFRSCTGARLKCSPPPTDFDGFSSFVAASGASASCSRWRRSRPVRTDRRASCDFASSILRAFSSARSRPAESSPVDSSRRRREAVNVSSSEHRRRSFSTSASRSLSRRRRAARSFESLIFSLRRAAMSLLALARCAC